MIASTRAHLAAIWARRAATKTLQNDNAARFPAMRHRNFRLFWTGNLISLIGTMAQQTAQGWLVRDLTSSPFLLTLVAACGTAPILIFTLPAGVVADRVDKRRALFVTNAAAAIFSLILAALVYFRVASVGNIALVAFGVGVVNAFDIPIRQSFNIEMVGREDLPNAIAFNSSAFNGARVAGPMVGGFLLRSVGIAGCFFINTLSFGALLLGLSLMRLAPFAPARDASTRAETGDGFSWPETRKQLAEGFRFVRGDAVIWPVVILVAWVSLFGMSFGTLLPIFARDVFRTDSAGYSHLLTFNGVGAMCAAIVLALSGKMEHKGKRLLLGAALFSTCVLGFATAPSLTIAFIWLIGAGWFLLTFLMTANTLVQTISPDDLRGRVFSLYSLALIGTSPLGALLIGAAAQNVGVRVAVAGGSLLSVAFTAFVFLRCRDLWKHR